jgi:PEP-CTERM motif
MRIFFKVLGVAAMVSLAALTASADSVDFNTSGAITFTGTGSGEIDVCFGSNPSCPLGGVLTGSASGTGELSLISGFSLTSTAPVVLTEGTEGEFDADAGTTLGLSLNTALGDIVGNLTDLVFLQPCGSQNGLVSFNANASDLNNIALGILNASADVSGSLNLDAGNTNLCSIIGGTGSGSGGFSPTPEPTTLALFGTGLLMFGGALRHRFAVQNQ